MATNSSQQEYEAAGLIVSTDSGQEERSLVLSSISPFCSD